MTKQEQETSVTQPRTERIFCLDNAIINEIVKLADKNQLKNTRFYKELEKGNFSLGVSFVNIIEIEKHGAKFFIDKRYDLFSKIEKMGRLKTFASPLLVENRELYRYMGGSVRENEIAFVPGFGQHIVSKRGQDTASSPLNVTVSEYIKKSDPATHKKNMEEVNQLFDQQANWFDDDRKLYLASKNDQNINEYPFNKSLVNHLRRLQWQSEAVRINETKILRESDDTLRKQFPFVWAIHSLWKQLCKEEGKTFAQGDVRDVHHAAYTFYVDLITVDGGTKGRTLKAKWPKDLQKKMMRNGNFKKQYLTPI